MRDVSEMIMDLDPRRDGEWVSLAELAERLVRDETRAEVETVRHAVQRLARDQPWDFETRLITFASAHRLHIRRVPWTDEQRAAWDKRFRYARGGLNVDHLFAPERDRSAPNDRPRAWPMPPGPASPPTPDRDLVNKAAAAFPLPDQRPGETVAAYRKRMLAFD
jgi:hypothetical protein